MHTDRISEVDARRRAQSPRAASPRRRLRLALLGALVLTGWGVTRDGLRADRPGVDLNGDGVADAVFADGRAERPASVCFGAAAGGFTGCAYPGGAAFRAADFAVGDVDGDERPDLVFADAHGDRMCRNVGATFTCELLAGEGGERVAFAELDGDGHLDALFAGFARPARACLNDGGGALACAPFATDAPGLVDLAPGDFDGDGDLDVLLADRADRDRLCLNDGRGRMSCTGFGPRRSASLGVAAGDLDGDGDLDAVFADARLPSRACRNDGRGAFACWELPEATRAAHGVALRDLDGDGDVDLLLADAGGSGRRCHNDGAARFTCARLDAASFAAYGVRTAPARAGVDAVPARPAATAAAPDAACPGITVAPPVVDTATVGVPFSEAFTQSGLSGGVTYDTPSTLPAGLALTRSGPLAGVLAGLPARLRCSSISFASEQGAAAGSGFHAVAVADFDHDGHADLALADAGDVALLRGNGDGTLQGAAHFASGGSAPLSLAVGRFDADVHDDLAVADTDGRVHVLLGDGAGGFAAPVLEDSVPSPQQIVAGDFTGDGRVDLALVGTDPDQVAVLPGNGDGTFQARVTTALPGVPWSLAAANLDADGRADLVVTLPLDDRVAVLRSAANGTFASVTTHVTGAFPQSALAADVDGDGKLDVVVAHGGDTTASVLRGDGAGGLQMLIPDVQVGGMPLIVASGDFDGDTRADLAFALQDSDRATTLLGRGDGTFQPAAAHALSAAPQALAVGDFNGDTQTDFVVAKLDDGVGVVLNTSTCTSNEGSYAITVSATDATCAGSTLYTLTVGHIRVSNPPGTSGPAGAPIVPRTFQASGTQGAPAFAVASGTLPSGVSLDSSTGVLSGTPTTTGTFVVRVKATDANGDVGTGAAYTLTITCPTLSVINPLVSTGTAGVLFSQTFTQTGGVGAPRFSLALGTLPDGLTLDENTGVLSGTPTRTGPFTLRVMARDANDCSATGATYTLTVNCGPLTVTAAPPQLTLGVIGAPYSQTFTQSGGIAPLSYATSSLLPGGLSLSSGGTLAGTPTAQRCNPFFGAPKVTPTTIHVRRAVVAQLDNFGANDLLVVGAQPGSSGSALQSLSGLGDGRFTPVWTGTVPGYVSDAVPVDSRGAGIQDVAAANSDRHELYFGLGTGSGTFSSLWLQPVTLDSGMPRRLIARSINADAWPDLVIANSSAVTVAYADHWGGGYGNTGVVHYNPVAGSNTFWISDMAIADVTNDGWPDVVSVGSSTAGYDLSVLRGQAGGSFQPALNQYIGSPSQGIYPQKVQLARVGALDSTYDLLAIFSNGTLQVWEGLGWGAFNYRNTLNTGGRPYDFTVADFNGDGRNDVAAQHYDGRVGLALGNADFSFQAPTTYASLDGAFITSGQLNADGRPDLVVTGSGSGSGVAALINTYECFVNNGNYPIVVTATDANGCTGSTTHTLSIGTCPTISVIHPEPASGTVGVPLVPRAFSATGGAGGFTYAVHSGVLPPGVTLDSATGVLSGTPTQGGSFEIRVRVSDVTNGCYGVSPVAYTFSIACPPLALTPAPTDQSVPPDTSCRAALPSFATGTVSGGCGTVTLTQIPTAGSLLGLGRHAVSVTLRDTLNNTKVYGAAFDVIDPDGDGVCGSADNCPDAANPAQSNVDADTRGDVCDPCPGDASDQCIPGGSIAREIDASQGGTVQTGDGNVTLSIPRNALSASTTISVTQTPTSNPIVNLRVGGSVTTGLGRGFFDLEPDGTTFNPPATLAVKVYVGAVAGPPALDPIPSSKFRFIKLYSLDPALGTWSSVSTSCVDSGNNYVTCTANVSHFSRWAVALTEFEALDDFERGDGVLGADWSGFSDGANYQVLARSGQAWYGGPIYWRAGEALGPRQEAYVTLPSISAGALDNGLLLKVQSDPVPANSSDEPDWIKGCIGVSYNAADHSVYVATFRPDSGAWNVYASQPLTLAAGDQLHAQALDDGSIVVLRNAEPVATFALDAGDQAFFNGRGGRIGLWFEQSASTTFDDFGGGTITP